MSQAKYFRREDAARHVRETWGFPCSPKWLAKLATVGGGPIFHKAGRIPIYAPAECHVAAINAATAAASWHL